MALLILTLRTSRPATPEQGYADSLNVLDINRRIDKSLTFPAMQHCVSIFYTSPLKHAACSSITSTAIIVLNQMHVGEGCDYYLFSSLCQKLHIFL